ncbi:MAG: rhomboid family intramembrane serine protease [Crenarchaeota archaeon]|nr:rhomboid family intramembrane serine protease [Thermoproteota archaeon]
MSREMTSGGSRMSFGIPMGSPTGFKTRPTVTIIIILINVLIYVLTSYESFFIETSDYWASIGGFIPSLIETPFQWYRVFTSMFLHADFFHLFFNMYFLYVFGRAVESVLGKLRFLLLYLIAGVAASVFHTAFSFLGGFSAYTIPAIGASGAISGILGAYLLLYPGTYLVVGWGFIFLPMFFRIKAAYYIVFWFATQVIYGFTRTAGGTAVFAHAGGFVMGIGLLPLLVNKRRIAMFRILRAYSLLPYLMPIDLKKRGLGFFSKTITTIFIVLLLAGAAYASLGLAVQGTIKSTSIQYTCEEILYVDYVGIQLPDLESQIASVSLDTTKILLNRLNAAGLLYNTANSNRQIVLNNINTRLPVRVRIGSTVSIINVNTTLHYFIGTYDSDGFLSNGEGKLTTRAVSIALYGQSYRIVESGPINYVFKVESQTVDLTSLTRYTGTLSASTALVALFVVLKKNGELTLIEER